MLAFFLIHAIKDMDTFFPFQVERVRHRMKNTEVAVESVGAVFHGPATQGCDT